MTKGVRRRPGQRAIASNAREPSGYNLDRDRTIRARARFEGLSLGEVCRSYGDGLAYAPIRGESFIARERYRCVPNEELSESEIAFHDRMAEVRRTGLPNLPKRLQSGACKAVLAKLETGAARARRARPTASVVVHVAELRRQPRYIRLNLDAIDDAQCVPY